MGDSPITGPLAPPADHPVPIPHGLVHGSGMRDLGWWVGLPGGYLDNRCLEQKLDPCAAFQDQVTQPW